VAGKFEDDVVISGIGQSAVGRRLGRSPLALTLDAITAGGHQVDGARLAVGHAAGGYSNCVAMWVVGSERP
jgi:hypothetical protein